MAKGVSLGRSGAKAVQSSPVAAPVAAALAEGRAALARGEAVRALSLFRQAVMAAPELPEALRDLGLGLMALGRSGEALMPLLAALERAPRDAETLCALGELAQAVGSGAGDVTLSGLPAAGALLAILACDRLDHERFAMLILARLQGAPPVAPLFRLPPAAGADWLLGPDGAAARKDPLLLAYLTRTLNLHGGLELTLAATRRRIVMERLYRGLEPAFLAALVRQCRNNEFVWLAEADEDAAVERLAGELASRIAAGRKLGAELLIYACYRPLEGLSGFGRRIATAEREAAKLVDEVAGQARDEAELKKSLPCLTPLSDAVSQAVARQYEDNPYPRWLGVTVPATMPEGDAADVLIAGCGTGKQTVLAAFAYGARARITAVDLSRASLAYAARMSRAYGVDNVHYAQADILALAGVDSRFDIIECAGVLHHMADPLAGWRVLAGLLKPGGTMRVSLYSKRARAAVEAGHALIAARGLSAEAADIRRFRHEVLGGGLPALRLLAEASADFYSLSGTRDLLFHVQEHRFTIPHIAECLAALGLEFGGFVLPARLRAQLLAEVGCDAADLAGWDEIERRHPDLFRHMYHFTCRLPASP